MAARPPQSADDGTGTERGHSCPCAPLAMEFKLAGDPSPRFDPESLMQHISKREWKLAAVDLRAISSEDFSRLIAPGRLGAKYLFELACLETRLALLKWFGMGVDVAFAPLPNFGLGADVHEPPATGRSPTEVAKAAQIRQMAFKAILAGLQAVGAFDAKGYSVNGANARALVNSIKKLRSKGTQVLIVLMPESKPVRDRVPPEAQEVLKTVLNDAFGDNPPDVIDFRAAMSDDMFADATHLNDTGEQELTKRLAGTLNSYLKR